MSTSSHSFDGSVAGFFSSPDNGEVLITNRQLIALFVATVLLSGLAFGLGVHAGSRMNAQVRLVNPGDLAAADRRAKVPVETVPVKDTVAEPVATVAAPAPTPAVAAVAAVPAAVPAPKARELTPIEESALAAQKEQKEKAAKAEAAKLAAAKAADAKGDAKAVAAAGKIGPYMVQTSSWPDKAGAEKACGIWAQRGFACATNPAEVKGKGTWYQVRIGAYPSAEAAKKALGSLKRDFGVNGMVAKAAQRV